MKDNNESWVLFQLHDEVLDRWSPVYCGATRVSVRMEVDEVVKKTAGRPVTVRILGDILDGDYIVKQEQYEVGDFSMLEVKDEVSTAK